jgi:RNase P/RNase MRP subunit p30
MFVIMRSTANKQVQLLTQPWRVRELPSFVLKRGPWKIIARRDEAHLKLNYRRALAREGYCVVDADAALYRSDIAQDAQ